MTFPNLGQTDFLACWARNCQTEPISLSNFYCAGRRRALLVCVFVLLFTLFILDLVKTTNFCVDLSKSPRSFRASWGAKKNVVFFLSFFIYKSCITQIRWRENKTKRKTKKLDDFAPHRSVSLFLLPSFRIFSNLCVCITDTFINIKNLIII